MKKIILTIVLSINLLSCNSQVKNTMTENPLLNNLKKYPYEPIYDLEVETLYNYDIWINDIPILSKHSNDMTYFGTIATPTILKSGEQHLKIKIYPYTPFVSEGSEPLPQKKYLKNGVKFILKVEQSAWIKGGGGREEPKKILTYNLPQYEIDNQGEEDYNKPIDYSKNTELTREFTFVAKVPYELEGWGNSEDLTKIDTLELKKQVLNFYKNFRNIFENGDSHSYINHISKAEYRMFQCYYQTPEEGLTDSNKWVDFASKGKSFKPIENGRLQFSGNGKIVSIRGVNPWDKNEGVLRYCYTKNGFNYVLVFDIFLHKPKGAKDFEIVWYQMLDKNFFKREAK
ncbi:hypothetical protein ACHRVK_11985 [Flavobacterium plurextorum]|uniref:hypothetical protein n=1 Tax=Flavobacterium plurextorum TaxID=1114867 RepID=UPI003757B9C8